MTYVYRTRGRFELFDRLISLRHFEKVKILFNVKNPKELKDKLTSIKEKDTNSYRKNCNDKIRKTGYNKRSYAMRGAVPVLISAHLITIVVTRQVSALNPA